MSVNESQVQPSTQKNVSDQTLCKVVQSNDTHQQRHSQFNDYMCSRGTGVSWVALTLNDLDKIRSVNLLNFCVRNLKIKPLLPNETELNLTKLNLTTARSEPIVRPVHLTFLGTDGVHKGVLRGTQEGIKGYRWVNDRGNSNA